MPTFAELMQAAQAAQPRKLFEGLEPPGPLPLTAWQEFTRSLVGNELAGVLGTPTGLLALAIPGEDPFEKFTAALHHDVKQLVGVPEQPAHPTAALIGGFLGDLLGLLPGGIAGNLAARALGKTAAFKALSKSSPLLARYIQTTIESIGGEAGTERPTWTGVFGFSVFDMLLRSRTASKILDNIFPKWRSPKVSVWDPENVRWLHVDDLVARQSPESAVFRAIQALAIQKDEPVDTIMSTLARTPIREAWRPLYDPKNIVVSEVARNVQLVTTSGKRFELSTPDAILDATLALLDGDGIKTLVGPEKHIAALKRVFIAQSKDEIMLLFKTAPTNGEEIAKFTTTPAVVRTWERIKAGKKPKNYAVVKYVEQDEPALAVLTPSVMRALRNYVHDGSAQIIEFALFDASAINETKRVLDELFPKLYSWEDHKALVSLAHPNMPSHAVVEFRPTPVTDRLPSVGDKVSYAVPTAEIGEKAAARKIATVTSIDDATKKVVLDDGNTVSIDATRLLPVQQPKQVVQLLVNADGTPSDDLIRFLTNHPNAKIRSVYFHDLSDPVKRYNFAAGIRAAQAIPETSTIGAGKPRIKTDLEEVPKVDVEVAAGTPDVEIRNYPGRMTALQHSELKLALSGFPERWQDFVDIHLAKLNQVFSIDVAATAETAKGAFLRALIEGVKRGDISPLNYTLSAILARNLPDEIFDATMLSLEFSRNISGKGRLLYDTETGLSKILLTPNASYDVIAHELAEQTLRILRPEAAREVAQKFINTADEVTVLAHKLANFSTDGTADTLDIAASVLAEYMLDRFVYQTLPARAARILDNSPVFKFIRTVMNGVWNSVRAVLGLKDKVTDVHRVFDKLFTPVSEGGWLEVVRHTERTTQETWRELLKDFGHVSDPAHSVELVSPLVEAIQKRFAKSSKVRMQRRENTLTFEFTNLDAGKARFAAIKRLVSEMLNVDQGAIKWNRRLPDDEIPDAVTTFGKDWFIQSEGYTFYRPVITVGDKDVPIGIIVRSQAGRFGRQRQLSARELAEEKSLAEELRRKGLDVASDKEASGAPTLSFYFEPTIIDHLMGRGNPAYVDFDAGQARAFINAAANGYEMQFRKQVLEQVSKDSDTYKAAARRIVYNLGMSSFEAAQLRFAPSLGGETRLEFTGASVARLNKLLAEKGWTVENLLYGFDVAEKTVDGARVERSLSLGQWTRAAYRKSITYEKSTIGVVIDDSVVTGRVRVRYQNGAVEEFDIDRLYSLPFTDKRGGRGNAPITEIRASDPDAVLYALDNSTRDKSRAPLLIINDRRDGGSGKVKWYLRRDGYALAEGLDAEIMTDKIVGQQGIDPDDFIDKFMSEELNTAISAGYKIQAVYGQFGDMSTDDVAKLIRRGLKNTQKVDAKALGVDPAGLRFLMQRAEDRGMAVVPSQGKLVIVDNAGQIVARTSNGEEALDVLSQFRPIEVHPDEALAYDIAMRTHLAEKIKPPKVDDDPLVGASFFERVILSGKTVVDKFNLYFSGRLGPMHTVTGFIQSESKGAHPLWDLYHKADHALARVVSDAADDVKELFDGPLGKLTKSQAERVSLALAHYVGASEEVLRTDQQARAMRAMFLQHMQLDALEMEAIRAVDAWHKKQWIKNTAILTERGDEVPTHIFGYVHKLYENTDTLADELTRLKTGSARVPGQFKERVRANPGDIGNIKDIRRIVANYAYKARHYEYTRDLVVDINERIASIRAKKAGKTQLDLLALKHYEHILNNITGLHGTPPTVLMAAIADIANSTVLKGTKLDVIINDLITTAYSASLGFRVSPAIRNRTHPFLLLYPLVGKRHTKAGMAMARQFFKSPTPELLELIDPVHTRWLTRHREEAKRFYQTMVGTRDRPATVMAELGLTLMERTEQRNKAESFFAGVSLAREILGRLRNGESVSKIVASTPLQFFEAPVREQLLGFAEMAVRDSTKANVFYKRMGEEIVKHTAWVYGPLEMPDWARSRLARIMLMYSTWPLNYIHYIARAIRHMRTPTGEISPQAAAFFRRWVTVNAIGMSVFASLGISSPNMFFLAPAEYSLGPFAQLTADAYDAYRLEGDLKRPALNRFYKQLARTLVPVGGGIQELLRIKRSIDEGYVEEVPMHLIGTPQRWKKERPAK